MPSHASPLRTSPWWIVLFFVIGVFATASVVVAFLLPVGRNPARMDAASLPPVDSEDFLAALAGSVDQPVQRGGSARLLDNGDAFYPAVLRAIRSATRSVTFLVYIWEDGEVSHRLLDALVERAGAGVQVRLLLDAFGAEKAPRRRIAALEAAGGKVAWYRPREFGKLTRYHRRNHRRAIVVDGTLAFTGGAAVADKWKGSAAGPAEWRDSMVEVTGPVAESLQRAFAQSWSGTSGEILVGPAFFPGGEPAASAGEPETRHVAIASSPAPEAHPLRTLFWLSFGAARRRLYIASSYFVPDAHLRRMVAERARAGVDVRLLLPGEHTDAHLIRWASQGYYDELLAAGVRIYEFQPTFMHAKTVSIDGVWSIVGSANMDVRSHELNEENVLAMLDPRLAGELERSFLADLERARPIRLEEWRRRGLWPRLRERLAVTLAEQY